MSEYLLDTNVVSESVKRRPDANVVSWLASDPSSYLSALTIGELLRGVMGLRAKEPERAQQLESWVHALCAGYASRILAIDEAVMERWAALPAHRTLPTIDSLIAATALAHGLTVATRNTRDFTDSGVAVFDPFTARAN